MYIKAQTVIPASVKITKLAPSEGKAKSIYYLLRAEEKKLAHKAELEVRARKFAAALKVGYSATEALKLIKE